MRIPSDLPGGPRRRGPRPPRPGRPAWASRGRLIVLVLAVVVVLLVLSARSLSNFYVDLLWFDSVDRSSVFWDSLWAKVMLGAVFSIGFAIVCFFSLTLAQRLAPPDLPPGPEREIVERYRSVIGGRSRLLRFVVSIVAGIMIGLPAVGQWQEWLLFRNAQSFGVEDPLFKVDVGFYVFRLPFLTYAVDWAFAALVLVTLMSAVVHFLNGAIRVQTPKERVTKGARVHLSVLFALLAVVKAVDYWLQRFELTVSTRGVVQGATYTDVKAQLPAINLLILVSLLVAVLFLAGIRWGGWRFPLLSMALWAIIALVASAVYPAIIQRFVVQPNVTTRERPYIGRNIDATQAAMGLDSVVTVPVTLGDVTPTEVRAGTPALADTRLLDVAEMRDRFALDEGQFAFFAVNDLDVDRYEIDGRRQQTLVAARELNSDGIPNRTWVSRHLIYTHGCGLISASASRVTSDGRPIYEPLEVDRPQLYYGTKQPGYAIVNTNQVEQACPETEAAAYEGDGGIRMNSTFRRLAMAIHFGEFNLFGSNLLEDSSRILHIRDVRDRVAKVAPFLHLDADPYPVAVDGSVQWVIDAFTTTARYPYAQKANTDNLTTGSGLDHNFNYVRNSVKAVVDAYTGDITLYVIDPTDPIVRAWSKAYPGLFTPADQVSDELRSHFRYPEDLFRVQTTLYGRYQFSDADQFFNRDAAWSVAQAAVREPELVTAGASGIAVTDVAAEANTGDVADARVSRFEPYYTLFHAPGSDTSEFSLIRPFVPFSPDDTRKELRAVMAVSNDPDTYGQITVYSIEGALPEGPATVAAELGSDPEISPVITLLDQRGSRVVFGQLQVIPVGDGVMWVRPLYVRPDDAGSKQVFVRRVLAWYDGRSVIGDSLTDAVNRLFPAADVDLNEVSADGSSTDTGTEPSTPSDGETPVSTDPAVLLEQAEAVFDEADQALRDGDLGLYQEKVAEAQDLISQALAALNA
ncbi:MAG: UPF0182 family protein [Actinomycetota bacterium]